MSGVPSTTALVRAELRKLLSRTGVRICVLALSIVSVGVPAVLFLLSLMVAPSPETLEAGVSTPAADATTVMSGVLGVRNFFVFRAMIIAVVAVSFAGEFTARTLREDLIRPVTRGRVLWAKWCALQGFVAMGVWLPLLLSAPLGLLLFGIEGSPREVLITYGLTWLGDVGFATLVMAISLGLRSVPGTIGGVFLYWVFDRALGWSLWAAESGREFLTAIFDAWGLQDLNGLLDAAIALRPWLPSSAFNLYWDYDPAGPWVWQSFVALVVFTGAAYAFAWGWFQRLDVD